MGCRAYVNPINPKPRVTWNDLEGYMGAHTMQVIGPRA